MGGLTARARRSALDQVDDFSEWRLQNAALAACWRENLGSPEPAPRMAVKRLGFHAVPTKISYLMSGLL